MTALGQSIGNAAALALEAAGARVLATDMDVQSLQIADSDGVAAIVAGRAPFRGLLDCAGMVHSAALLELPPGDRKAALRLNVIAMAEVMRVVLPGTVGGGGDTIINISSAASSLKVVPSSGVTFDLDGRGSGADEILAGDCEGQKMRCGSIWQGPFDSPSLQGSLCVGGDHEESRHSFVARQPMAWSCLRKSQASSCNSQAPLKPQDMLTRSMAGARSDRRSTRQKTGETCE